ncbi:AraC family transcriptional regulator [Anaeroarcus burkinensis]|uniref:AraC family transcriptional regulator n=1 Tax=Anaeroarcus burkinensis TaxID=82376 RepID=UPI0004017FD0|nr:helix-turn-helix domain-containing protein [Anaeroarcus burkinensis]
MYTKPVSFADTAPTAATVRHIDECPLHCHEDVLEIILVLQGTVQVKISFEYFTLHAGDYVIVNKEDSHKIWSLNEEDNMVAVFHIPLPPFRTAFPHLDYVLFACESFDLATYKGQTAKLRRLLLTLLESLLQDDDSTMKQAAEITSQLMQVLVEEYSLERYYNRNQDIDTDKRETYYAIIRHIYENYQDKNLLQDISRRKFYSESYISHLFREVSAASFQDMLGYIRVFRAERLLLETSQTLALIAKECGFSDSKYFNRTFQKWFRQKPSAYRKTYQPEIAKDIRAVTADNAKVKEKIRYWENQEDRTSEYRLSITPITLKNIGSKRDLIYTPDPTDLAAPPSAASRDKDGGVYALLRVGGGDNPEEARKKLEQTLRLLQQQTDGDLEYWFVK